MKKFCAVIFLLSALIAAQEIFLPATSEQLIEQAEKYDKQMVCYSGEVIGDIFPRGKKAWFNVYDGKNAIGVFADKNVAQKIKILGGYKYSGDKISVYGEFHRACPEHGGDLDIHAQSIEINSAGYELTHKVSRTKIFLTLIFSGLALCLALWQRRQSRFR